LYATVYAFFERGGPVRVHGEGRRPLAWSALALILVTLIQVTLGTQVREHIDTALAAGVSRAGALATVGSYDRWHRDVALVVLAGTVAIVWMLAARHRHERALVRAGAGMTVLVAGQLLLGLAMAYSSLTAPLQVAHLTGSSLLLGSQTVLFLLARWGSTQELRTKNEERRTERRTKNEEPNEERRNRT
jgi:cytochrome c oxidase assembly protein subunit 15